MVTNVFLRWCNALQARITRLQRLVVRHPFFLWRIIVALGLFVLYFAFALCYVTAILFNSPQATFAQFNQLHPREGYTVSYTSHRRWHRSIQLATVASTLVIIIITVLNGFFATPRRVRASNFTINCNSTAVVEADYNGEGNSITFSDGGDGICTLDNPLTVGTTGSITIQDGVTVNQAAQDSDGVNITTGNLTINNGGAINVDSKGCDTISASENGYGPNGSNVCTISTAGYSGTSTTTGGGAYGGAGGAGLAGAGGSTYGSVTAPTLMGSSAGNYSAGINGGNGGGLIQLTVASTFTHNGAISADGGNGNGTGSYAAGGGSGGGVNITVSGNMNGTTGTFSADGGTGGVGTTGKGGGGGGGRIAVTYSGGNFSFTSSNVTAAGGTATSAAVNGSKGTSYIKDTSTNTVKIFHGFTFDDTDYNVTTWTMDSSATNQYCATGTTTPSITATTLTLDGTLDCTSVTVTSFNFSAATLALNTNTSLAIKGHTNFSATSSLSIGAGSSITLSNTGSNLDMTIPAGNNQTWTNVSITLPNQGIFTIDDAIGMTLSGTTSITSNVQWSNLTSLQIDSGAEIDVGSNADGTYTNTNGTAKGCVGSTAASGNGPNGSNVCTASTAGYGTGTSGNGGGGGAGYGGAGGNGSGGLAGGATYGSESAPTLFGSSGGGASGYGGGRGGGLAQITVNGNLTHNGAITADGNTGLGTGANAAGGGSGGAIYLNISGTISGTTGTLYARGGKGGDYNNDGGGGGGGRITVDYITNSSSWLGGLTAATNTPGAAAVGSGQAGSNGSVYTLQYTIPATPSLSAPVANTYNNSRTPTLTASTYSSNGKAHTMTDWKVTSDAAGNTMVWSKNDDTSNLTSIVVNTTNGTFSGALSGQTQLASNTTYYAFVRYTNIVGDSSWASVQTFTTVYSGTTTTQTWNFNEATPSGVYTYNTSNIEINASANSLARLKNQGGGTYASGFPADLTSWSRRKSIVVTNNIASNLTNYQVNISVTYDSDMQADFDDIRFTSNDGTLIDYWLESKTDSTAAVFWVEVPSISASSSATLYMYYGNGSATSTSNSSNTLIWYDDFSSNTLANYTQVGAWTWSSGYAISSTANTEDFLVIDSLGNLADIFVEIVGKSNDDDGTGAVARYSSGAAYYTCTANPQGDTYGIGENAGRDSYLNSAATGTQANTDWITTGLGVYGSSLYCYYENGATSLNLSTTDTSLTTGKVAAMSYFNNPAGNIDSILVRNFVYPEPTVGTAGTEQSSATAYADISIYPAVSGGTHPTLANLYRFSETLGAGNQGNTKYQVGIDTDNDGTITSDPNAATDGWYYLNSSTWTIVSSDVTDNNTATTIDTYLPSFTSQIGTGSFYFRVFLISNGTQAVELDSITLQYNGTPTFTGSISNQTTLEDTNITNAFDLDSYFSDGDTLTYSIINGLSSDLGTMTVNSNGTVDFTLTANANGSDTVQFRATDTGSLTVDSNTVTITVNSVNDVPSFTKGSDPTILEDAGAQSSTSWATSLSTGPSNESSQTVSFTVSNDNNSLFTVQPAIASNGTLSYTPAANAAGVALITVSIVDNGGTANSGDDTSDSQSFTLTITNVNDPPSFTKGSNPTILEDAGAQSSTSWATSISTGPSNESAQTLTFAVSNNNNSLFSTQPAINATTGTLTYTPTTNANGVATVTINLSDSGGVENSGDDTAETQTLTITVTAVNDAPTANAGVDQSINEEASTVTLTGSASSDVDNDSLSYTWLEVLDSSDACSLSNTNVVAATVALADKNSNYSCIFRLTINDSSLTASDEITVNVTANNDTPILLSISDKTIAEGDNLNFSVGANDTDSTNLSLSASDGDGKFVVRNIAVQDLFTDNHDNTGRFSWTPPADTADDYQVDFSASDGANTAVERVNITVQSSPTANHAPIFQGSLPNVTFTADTTITAFNLNDYFSDEEDTTLTYSVSETTNLDIIINQGVVTMAATNDAIGSYALFFTAQDSAEATATSNAIVVTVTEATTTANIVQAQGTMRGAGIIKLLDADGNVINSWTTFTEGGVIPRLETIQNTIYVFAVKVRSGSTLRIYTITGQLIQRKRLSPRLHWRRLATGELDNNPATIEIVIATRRDSALYFKIFTFNPTAHKITLVHRGFYKPMTRYNYSINVNSTQHTILLRSHTNKLLWRWKPKLK